MLLLLLTLSSLLPCPKAFTYTDLRIDCGSLNPSNVTAGGELRWRTDEEFIRGGENKLLQTTNLSNPIQMNTLRFFPKGKANCYELLLFTKYHKFLFRAGFYYGDYDGLSKPPSFGLQIDGKLWANVTTSMGQEPVYHELLYILKEEQVRVCLVREKIDEIPFISSLEATVVYDSYQYMDNNTALYLHSRINYGANKSVE